MYIIAKQYLLARINYFENMFLNMVKMDIFGNGCMPHNDDL